MGKGCVSVVLVDFLEHFHKNNLRQILRIHAARQVAADNTHNQREEVANQFARRLGIILFDALQPSVIKYLFGHSSGATGISQRE